MSDSRTFGESLFLLRVDLFVNETCTQTQQNNETHTAAWERRSCHRSRPQKWAGSYRLLSRDLFLQTVPEVHTELWEGLFKSAAPSAWSQLQDYLNLRGLISLDAFQVTLNDLEARTSGWRWAECWWMVVQTSCFCNLFIVLVWICAAAGDF